MIEVQRVKTSDRGIQNNRNSSSACYDVLWHGKHMGRYPSKREANQEADRMGKIEDRYQRLLNQSHPAALAQSIGFASRYP